MMKSYSLLILSAIIILPLSTCFTFQPLHVQAPTATHHFKQVKPSSFVRSILPDPSYELVKYRHSTIKLSEDSDVENDAESASISKRRRRTRRKVDSIVSDDTEDEAEESIAQEASKKEKDILNDLSPKSSSNQFVEMEVLDIRAMTSGTSSKSVNVDDDDYEYDDEEDEVAKDSLEGLLADAKRLRASREKDEEEDGSGIVPIVKNVISTIVTIDFFVVFGLLLWFLAGIFSSYVLKSDAIQIAFNGIFEPIVQPALGLLMIASAAGAAMGKKDE